MDRAVPGAVPHLCHTATREIKIARAAQEQFMSQHTQTPQTQRRAIWRTVLVLVVIVSALFALTVWRGVK